MQYSANSSDPDREGEFSKTTKHLLMGPVVVTRNPCLHPGDVRQLTAVHAPKLAHLVDCVVFPNHGPRPHPSEMAGNSDTSAIPSSKYLFSLILQWNPVNTDTFGLKKAGRNNEVAVLTGWP